MVRSVRTLCGSSPLRNYSTGQRFMLARQLRLDRKDAASDFDTSQPAILPQQFCSLPAIDKWFQSEVNDNSCHAIHKQYLEQYDSTVALELTRTTPTKPETSTFERFNAPLSLLLAHMDEPATSNTRLYLAQHSLDDLPLELQNDLPQPAIIRQIGRGDIYGSSLWMGRPPTRTPLHRDPNPNIFVQLAGRKHIRLLNPHAGRSLYENIRVKVGKIGGRANIRDDGMMKGLEMEELEKAIWEEDQYLEHGIEAQLSSGDGLYIPLGWWHAVHGVGTGVNASANWWFR